MNTIVISTNFRHWFRKRTLSTGGPLPMGMDTEKTDQNGDDWGMVYDW